MDLVELKNFLQRVNDIYGLYRDADQAFLLLAEKTETALKKIPRNIDLAKLSFGYVEKDKSEMDDGTARHISTAADYVMRNKIGGANHIMMANFCMVLIYTYWEYHRQKIETSTEKTIQSDLMGDITSIRNAIIHKKGILHKNLKLIAIKKGDQIKIDKEKFDSIVDSIKEEVGNIANDLTGE